MIKFVLMVNKQGQTRLAQYYEFMTIEERVALEAEIIRKCLGRNENQVSWFLKLVKKIVFEQLFSVLLWNIVNSKSFTDVMPPCSSLLVYQMMILR